MKIKHLVAAIMSIGISLPASALEMSEIPIKYAKIPPGIEIMGVKTGITSKEAEKILIERGYKLHEKKEKIFPCETIGRRICLSFKGNNSYNYNLSFNKDNEIISLHITPPYAGSIIIEVNRYIFYGEKSPPLFKAVFDVARPKFGRSVFFGSWACWEYKSGSLLDNPETGGKACQSAPMYRDISDGYTTISRKTKSHLNGRNMILFSMYDKIYESQLSLIEQNAIKKERSRIEYQKQKEVESTPPPKM